MEMLATSFTSQGFVVVPDVVDSATCSLAASRLDETPSHGAGSRRLLIHPWCQELAHRVRQHAAVAALMLTDSVAVQCTVFDKSPSKNWLVAFHQDRSIPVRRRVESPSLTGWSEKEG